MTSTASNYLSRDQYFALDNAEQKYEFYQGEIFAMTGGTFNHAAIGVNTVTALKIKLRGKSCQPTNSDMRVETPTGLITYPDVTVFCGKPELTENQCGLLNPVVIIEVLSPSTRAYDSRDKFTLYRSIETFKDYLLIDSEKIFVQHFRKIENNEWVLHDYLDLNESIYLTSIQETLSLYEIYENIGFEL
jgi:Uma2 family endonuclease